MDDPPPLFAAISATDSEQLAALLDEGADIEQRELHTDVGDTPLLSATSREWPAGVQLLLERGAHVDCRNQCAQTPLHVCCRGGRADVAELLLAHGADVSLRDRYASTALMKAVDAAHVEVVNVLLDYGAQVDDERVNGWTVIHLAVSSGYPDLTRLLERPEAADVLDARTDPHKEAALHEAAWKGNDLQVRQLLNAGASINVADGEGYTPLHAACLPAYVRVVRELLRRGANVDALTHEHETPLHCACTSSSSQATLVVEALLDHGADRSVRSRESETPRDVAEARGHVHVVEVLDTYFPLTLGMEQLVVGLGVGGDSALARFAQHEAFEPGVLWIVAAFHSGKDSGAFEELQGAVDGVYYAA